MDILSTALAQDIVTRTMRIIPYNVNVMDANGSIIASGNPARIGELHAGALLALAKKLTVEIDDASAKNMHGAQPGINLPLTVHGQLCGAVGLSGAPDELRQFGELVRLTAEMILEQAQLAGELQRDSRYREAFVLNLINGDHAGMADLDAWAHRLGVNFDRAHTVYILEVADADLQALQLRLQARVPAALNALLLAARQLRRAVVETLAEAEVGQQELRPVAGGTRRRAADQLRQDDVLGRAEVGQQMVELVDEAELVAPHRGPGVGVERFDPLPVDCDRAAEPAFEQPDRLEHGRLARSARSEQGDDLAAGDGQVDAAQDVDRHPALDEAAAEVGDFEDVTHSGARSPDRCSPPSTPGTASRGS